MRKSPPHPTCSKPSGPVSTTQINLSWTAVAGASGYKLQRSTTPGGPSTDLASPSWSHASAVLMGNGGVLLIEIPMAPNDPKQFYQVKVWRE